MHNKQIKLIATGGTIACKMTEKGLSPALSAQDMLEIVGRGGLYSKDLFSMDSSNVQPEEWCVLADEIRKTAKCEPVCGIVVTHGTDTMAYTASMLSFMLMDIDIPVVLTGAQTPIIYDNSDGRQNLKDALIAAEHLSRGVYIAFGGRVMLGCRAVKTHTVSPKAFESINYPYIAEIENGIFDMLCEPHLPNMGNFDISDNICPDVALIKLIPGTNPKIIDAMLQCGIKGLVVESFGMGGVHNIRRDHNESLIRLMNNGVCVVLTSQCLFEAASLDVYEVSRPLHDAGAISAGNMTTEAAVTKLMWALGQTSDMGKVKEMFMHDFCCEK